MSSFRSVVDIAARACQHVGVRKIASFTENSKAASEISSCYDNLREAEMRRNVWRFTIRKAAIRPVDSNTTTFTAPAFNIATTYPLGGLVLSGGQIWESTVAGNVGFTPGPDRKSVV